MPDSIKPTTFGNHFAGKVRLAEECGCPCGAGRLQPPHWTTRIHSFEQDTSSDAWVQLCEAIDDAAATGHPRFVPADAIGPDLWKQIVTLPRSIGSLVECRQLVLYGSNLRSISPEIGGMRALEIFEPYTSYRLHWFPYEITRCESLRTSTVSTRALYGNRKFRTSFPSLPSELPEDCLSRTCSICDGAFGNEASIQRWLSIRVATDVLPLLVQACSDDCLEQLPDPAEGYVSFPHEGGTSLVQPDPR